MSLRYINKKRKTALTNINDLVNNPNNCLLIHYSCESFYNITNGRTPRITSIAVRYFSTAQGKSFTIHRTAEIKNIPFNKIQEHYDEIEREMLKDFFQFVGNHKSYNWVHWNMRDFNYGFEAIENRYRVLGGRPKVIDDQNKFDLARILIDIYGTRYAGHPRLENLIDKNGISKRDFLQGKDEAEAFDNKDYVKLHLSTLKKVDVIHSILIKLGEGKLKTNSKWYEPFGLSAQGVYEGIKDHWIYALINLIVGALLGVIATKLFF
ncbi:hypothetical protein JOC86_004497 [Bacillus pakistanensis]|uniref:Uncharacterized protein n=1 Tax=Rossellomorea pakistanensis TaxID=992288 RepID=A0ABS2NJ81_9BACI|nr:hypothetical protein [Bacillus pakistanensis]